MNSSVEPGIELHRLLQDMGACDAWLVAAGIQDLQRGRTNLTSISQARVAADALHKMLVQLQAMLPGLSDPDMALNNFDRFYTNVRSRLFWATLCERDATVLPTLLQVFSTSQHLSDQMIRDPSLFDVLRKSQGAPVSKAMLIDELATELASVHDDPRAMGLVNAFKQRQLARIIHGDISLVQRLAVVTRQISYLADAICDCTLRYAVGSLRSRFGMPRKPSRDVPLAADDVEPPIDSLPSANLAGQHAASRRTIFAAVESFAVMALGKLGGRELNYSSDIDLLFIYGEDGVTDGPRSITTGEFFERLAKRLVQLLTMPTMYGTAYRVDLRLRPDGSQGAAVISRSAALRYYHNAGRTWERQAFLKLRPIAGDLSLGKQLQQDLEPWVYGKNLTWADMAGIKALKRKIESSARRDGEDRSNVKVGHGGIRDIEFSIQLLQLLLGGEFPQVRTGNTLEAMLRLEQIGGLTMQEKMRLEENYVFLRTIEHRLQIMFDNQTHRIPDDPVEQQKLALRMGYRDSPSQTALDVFRRDLQSRTDINRRILDHLLHNAVGEETDVEPERDLILDPSPDPQQVDELLAGYGFADKQQAYRLLMEMATEQTLFLSKRRCRHFLAAIAPRLLTAIAATPHPDGTLVSLAKVSGSIGGKGVLWELLSQSEPCLKLYVRLCAVCDYLSEILVSHPGMLDELMDSLLLERLPTIEVLEASLQELCRNAEDLEPILASFKYTQHLRVGARDIVGRENIRTTTAALADIAEVCVRRVAADQLHQLIDRWGVPRRESDGGTCELIILAAGKVGGREPNYHSDVDVIFLYEEDGQTEPLPGSRAAATTNQHFFGELGQRIIKMLSKPSAYGSLFSVDARLRPVGRSGPLAVPLAEFRRYFLSGAGQFWERMALCKARPIFGSPAAQAVACALLHEVISQPAWQPEQARVVYDMRMQLQETAAASNLKRGPGGTVDVEFALQMLQLKWAAALPSVLETNVWQAAAALSAAGVLDPDHARELSEHYELLRSVEARLRLMNTTARHEFPSDPLDVRKLAYLLRTEVDPLRAGCEAAMRRNREIFLQLINAA